MFDLKAIRAVPLDPEILSKTKQDGINIEQIRFTSLPGVRIYAILTYKDNAVGIPGYVKVERFGALPLMEQGKNGFFGMSVCAPTGNTDPKRMESLGGPKLVPGTFSINDAYTDDPNDSYIYQYTVALLRAMDYLATRPEVNLSITSVAGYSWAGTMVAILHALDDREAAYIVFHGLGQYVDENGMSGGGACADQPQEVRNVLPDGLRAIRHQAVLPGHRARRLLHEAGRDHGDVQEAQVP